MKSPPDTDASRATPEGVPLAVAARAFADLHGMFEPGACVVVLVSGGADSTTLLRLLAAGAFGDLTLEVVHVNHLLRGGDSDADEAFVRDLAAALGVESVAVKRDVAAYASAEGLNLEDAGRRVRYRIAEERLDALCDRVRATRESGRIAVAHTLDDRIETFFMRVITGAGATGLSSIAPVRGRIVRPLLSTTRQEVREWLGEIGQEWREDATNEDTERFRALVRHEIVPLAESVNPRFRTTLARSLDLLADDDALLNEMAEAFARDFSAESLLGTDTREDEIALDRSAMLTLSRPMARRTIRAALRRAFPEASRLDAAHIEAIAEGLAHDGFAHDLPGGLTAFDECGTLVISRAARPEPPITPGLLEVPGSLDLGSAGTISAEEAEVGDTSGSADSVVVDATDVSGPLLVDSVRPGDRMRPLGMQGTRKLSDMLMDDKVPRRMRPLTPVVREGGRIMWLAGVRMSEDHRVTPQTKRAVRLTWHRRDSQPEPAEGADGEL